MAIFATVVLYGLTAVPVARRLGVAGAEGIVALVVGGHGWALKVAHALRRAGAAVRVWTGDTDEQAAARAAGLEADRGRMMVDAVTREAELEEVTDALLLTSSDDFNALPPRSCASSWATITCSGSRPTRTRVPGPPPTRTGCC